MQPKIQILISLALLPMLAACAVPALTRPSPTSAPTTVPPTPTRKVFSPYCEEAMCDLTLDLTGTPAAGLTPITVTNTPPGEEEGLLYLAPVLVVQPDVPAELQQRAAGLFGGCGSSLSCESAAGAQAVLAGWETGGSMFGLQVAITGVETPDCASLPAGLQESMQVLVGRGVSSFYLSFKGAGCDWAALAACLAANCGQDYEKQAGLGRENGLVFVRAEPDFLAELPERLQPWRAGAGGWDQPDPLGGLVVFPSGSPVNCKSELASSVSPNPPCVLDQTDISVAAGEVEQALAELDGSRFSVYILPFYVEQEGDLALLRELLGELQPVLESGQARQVHLAEAYDLYIEWEGQGE